jgi:glycerol-3-phosphate dehydrogenase
MDSTMFDVLVAGGGINGAGIARDLAGRGLRVLLAERGDLAQHTSSASSKLIHGGLRYLEQGHIGLVRKSLIERERLLQHNPHLMQPLRLILPHDEHQRPRWMLRAGLFLYDHLTRLQVSEPSRAVALTGTPYGDALQPRFTHAFAYSDGWVDDARLVLACALDAQAHGARVLTRHAVTQAERRVGHWSVTLQPQAPRTGAAFTVQARALVNACGPWASAFLGEALQQTHPPKLRLVQGSHLVIRRRWTHGAGYLLQNPDGRVLFALPFHDDFTLIGTTDQEVNHAEAQPTDAEIDYLCEQASRWLRERVTRADIVHRWAGVRPLLDDERADANGGAKAITRDYRLDLDLGDRNQSPPRLDVWGGKLTTFRLLAEQAADRLAPLLNAPHGAWTANAPLPGGDCGPLAPFIDRLCSEHPERDPALISRWAMAYGSGARALLVQAPGEEVAPGLLEVELQHMKTHEWALTADDVLWRRSKLGLRLSAAQQVDVARCFAKQVSWA